MIYRCPRNCHVNDKGGRCPRCGEWMQQTSMSIQEIQKEDAERHKESFKALKGNDFERIDNSSIRRQKELLTEEEKKYFYNLKKHGK